MIPKKSTPIKHEILIDIFAKGLLNKNEMRIVAYIMRWSWGFDDKENSRRQDWTQKLYKRKIANDIGMNEGMFNVSLNKMIRENKILVKNGCYQFNEHFENWEEEKTLENLKEKTLGKLKENFRKTKGNFRKPKGKLYDSQSSTGENPLNGKSLRDPKDNKDTLKNNKEKLCFSFADKRFVNIKLYIDNFSEKYPSTNVYLELENMEDWLMVEYEKKKAGKKNKLPTKDYNLFVHRWLRKNEVSINEKF
ncbi:hypothetical protein ES705_51172 [subsurface metagenome]